MSTDLPSMPSELAALIAAERDAPLALEGLHAGVWSRLCKTFGWTGPGTIGGGGGGALRGVLAVLVIAGLTTAGYVALRGDSSSPPPGSDTASARERLAQTTIAGGEPEGSTTYDVAGRPHRSIKGRVIHAGAAVGGAQVILTSYASRAGVAGEVEVITGPDGTFDLGVHAAATYDVTATASGKGYAHVRVEAQDPTARPDELTLDLSGCDHVLEGAVRDASGGVIVGAQIVPTRGRWGDTTRVGAGTTTDETGRYTLCTRAGPITVVARAAGYGSVMVDDQVYRHRRLDLDLVPEVIVSGRVVHAETDAPVIGAKIWLGPAEWPKRFHTTTEVAVSDADGRFRIAGVAPGRHTVAADTGALWGSRPIAMRVGDTGEIVIRVEPLSEVRGRVVHAGTPVPGARVVRIRNDRRNSQPFIAGANGEFTLHTGAAAIGFLVEGYEVLSPREHVPGVDPVPIVIDVRPAGVIRGRVEHQGTPVPYASVGVSGRLPQTWDETPPADARGVFEIRGLPPGTYRIGATSDGLQAFSTDAGNATIELGPGETRTGVVVELDGTASISGTVVDQDGHAVAGVFVQYIHDKTGDLCRAFTGDDGAFQCGMMTGGGRYSPVVRPSRESEVHLPALDARLPAVELAGASTHVAGQVLRVRLVRARIAGRVIRSSGEPYSDVTVSALESDATASSPAHAFWARGNRVTSDAAGKFSIEVWNDATYALYTRAASGADATATGIRAGTSDVVIRLDDQGAVRGTLAGFDRPPTVIARKLEDTDQVFWASVDRDRYSIDRLTAGRYVVFAVQGAHATAEPVEVRSGATETLVLRARPTARIEGRVTDFVTGAPVAGVRCSAGPYVAGAGVFGWGVFASASDSDGRFAMESTSGSIEIGCLPDRGRWSEGMAHVVAEPGATTPAAVTVVVSGPSWRGIGARIELRQLASTGFAHVIAELRPDGSAQGAGLRVGDEITAIDARPVATLTDDGLARLLGSSPLGSTIRVTVNRAGKPLTVPVVIEGAWER